jgi:hypothetical protein
MNATDTRLTVHANCDHPTTKVARAACRRARNQGWALVTREDVRKGDRVRVTTAGDQVEGTLLGWGAKRLIVRDDTDAQRVFATADVTSVEAPAA